MLSFYTWPILLERNNNNNNKTIEMLIHTTV